MTSFQTTFAMHLSIIILIILLFSCQSKKFQDVKMEPRDSIIKEYLRLLDSTKWADSLNPEHQLLVAYNNDDTAFLHKMLFSLRKSSIENRKYPNPIPCLEPPGIEKYNFDEVYRFQYSAAFCDHSVNITVGERKDSILLIGYHNTDKYLRDSCVSVDSVKMQLSQNQWQEIRRGIKRADFWGLKPYVHTVGFDGSGLIVIGYEKPINAYQGRYHKVIRWSAEKTALGETFYTVWQMSKIKIPCFHY